MKHTKQVLLKNTRKGVYAPLFDCLSLDSTQNAILDFSGLKESIKCELEMILNTRPVAKEWQTSNAVDDVARHLPQYFGMRDFTLQQASTELGRRVIVQEIIKAIQAYEPRLKNVHVKLSLSSVHHLSAIVDIAGDIWFGNVMERTTFPVHVKDLFHHPKR
jgi:type VI secretion system lysozyme-like protein